MATIVPKNCVDSCPIAQVLHKNLNTQLDSSYRVIQYFLPHLLSVSITLSLRKGLLFWVQHERRSLFIYLQNSIESNISVSKLKLLGKSGLTDFLQQDEVEQLLELQKQVLPKELASYGSKLSPVLIINPYIKNKDYNLGLKSHGLYFSGKEIIKSSKLGVLIDKLLGIPASEFALNHMRTVFNPEIILSNSVDLLDNEQELVMKADIPLQEGNIESENYNLRGVNGGVNSGKTEVVIQRAKLIQQVTPESKILLITANNSFQQAVKHRFDKLSNNKKNIEIISFFDWCKQQSRLSERLVDNVELENIINSRLSSDLDASNINVSTLLHELDFIYGRKIFYKNQYLLARKSSSYPISEEQLSHIWKAHLSLKSELSSRNCLLPLSFPQLLLNSYQDQAPRRTYDHILVDDAHFLPPIAFELLLNVIKPESGQLFITQNPAQNIINSCDLWKDAKLDLHGQSIRLLNYYDINPAILNASCAFLQNRLRDENRYEILPVVSEIKNSIETPLPQLLHFHRVKDEENRLLNELKQKIHSGTALSDILIITSSEKKHELVKLIAKTLNVAVDLLSKSTYFSYNDKQQSNALKICSFSEAQALTAPFVYIFSLQDILNTEEKLITETEQFQEKSLENTHLISMLMTQAKQELVLFITSENIPEAFVSPYINIPTDNNDAQKKVADISYLHQLST